MQCKEWFETLTFIHPREVKITFQVLETSDSPNPWILHLQPSQMCISSFLQRSGATECHGKSVPRTVSIESLRFECPRSLHLLSG